jgi:hypothetical protein
MRTVWVIIRESEFSEELVAVCVNENTAKKYLNFIKEKSNAKFDYSIKQEDVLTEQNLTELKDL